MAKIVNLRRARKDRKRTEKERQAAENRAKFGRTKAQKKTDEAAAQRKQQVLDGKRLERGED